MATSSIERYTQVTMGGFTDRPYLSYAADDIAP